MTARKFADATGIAELWSKVKSYISGVLPTKTSDLTNDSGYITGMEILSYGISTWDDFTDAYNAKKVVYCRASSNSNPASGSQTRLAFMAYVNNAATPTEVEFQYYRSINTHTESQQGDQVFVYKLTSANKWTVTTREAASKVAAGGDLTRSYSNGTVTISGTIPTVPTNVSAFTNDAGYITGYTETDPIFSASAAAGIQSTDITNWNSKVGLSELSIGYINGNTLYISDKFKYRYQGDSEFTGKFYFVVPSEYANSTRDVANTTVTKVVISTAQITISSVTFTISGLYEGYVSDNTLSYTRIASISDIPTNVSDLTNDAGYITGYTETDPIFSASAAAGIQSTDITKWNKIYNLYKVNSENSGGTYWWKLTVSQDGLYNYTNAPGSGGALGKISIPNGKSGGSTTYINFVSDTNKYNTNLTFNLPNKDGTIALWSDIPTKVSDLTNDSGYITGYTETDPIFVASAAYNISNSDITNWNGKQAALVSGTNIKTVNNTSLLGSGNVAVQPTLVSGTNIKTINGNTLLGSGDLPIQSGGDKNVWYGTCATAMLDQNKVVTTSSGDFELVDGNIVVIYFEHPAIGVPTLNVDGTGATSIYYNDGSEHVFQEESPVSFVFDNRIGSFVAINRAEAYGNFYGLVKGNDIPHDISQISITVANWNATTTCTKSVTGVTASNSIIVSPAPSSISDYVSAGVYCSAQASGTLTFECTSTPTADLVVNVMIVG